MMLIHGLRVVAADSNTYHVLDSNRCLGGVVRYWVPATDHAPSMVKRFRAFGEDFSSLSDAVAEFLKIRGVRPCDPLGDVAS